MKKYLIPQKGNFYKANMHVHTTISDGNLSPLEIKKIYMEKGYSIVAFTDHEVMVPHLDLIDDDFLAITSTEIAINDRIDEFSYVKCYHLNIYSCDPNKEMFAGFNENGIWLKHSLDYVKKDKIINHYREYSVDSINEIIKKANEDNCFVSYNHPVWSMQDYNDYIFLKGLWGVEWFNNGCERSGFNDSFQPIEDLLRKKENVFPLATDDSHNINDCFGGFIMIKADNLQYGTIIKALKNGDFYSSSKPEIKELYIENGIINIETTDVKTIHLSSERRYNKTCKSTDLLNKASFDINDYLQNCRKNNNHYIRITIIDNEGNVAHTRAYFVKEFYDL